MDRVQNSADADQIPSLLPAIGKVEPSAEPLNGKYESPGHKYTKEANTAERHRNRRATRPKEDNRNTCSLFIQTDPFIWRHISEHVSANFVIN